MRMETVVNEEQIQEGRVLLVEDDEALAAEIVSLFTKLSLRVDHVAHGEEGLKRALAEDYSLLLLDIQLPGKNGLDICREVRAAKPKMPIIFLTSRSDEIDRVLGFELGADDYVVKPFYSAELLARVRAKLRRIATYSEAAQSKTADVTKAIEIAGLAIDPTTRHVTKDAALIVLTTMEFDLLHFLMLNPGAVFSKIQLLQEVWNLDHAGYEESVVSMVRRLRRKIDETGVPTDYIRTVHRAGYSFLSPETLKKA